ncbi:apolipoprotein D-like [Schistocerca americana]|uniref:apolipoprotein D-like n=1 Tax=Schistocerca americana TaxID=7009 RepID=UPI001F4FF49F|nr:apolipoprotein D-like [Schistocerca americana]XP_046992007.1 apolipoprotein D-like [Schistocerca americana]
MASAVSFVTVLALIATPSLAQIGSTGPCPNVTLVSNFDAAAYLGKWYEQYRFFAIFEGDGECVTATYTDNGDGTVGVENAMIDPETGDPEIINGQASVDGNTTEGRLVVIFPQTGSFEAPYWILDTDYGNYSVVWSCIDIGGAANMQFSWLLTREKFPTDELIQNMFSVMTTNGLDTERLRKTNQTCEN